MEPKITTKQHAFFKATDFELEAVLDDDGEFAYSILRPSASGKERYMGRQKTAELFKKILEMPD